MNITNKSLQIRHFPGQLQINPGETRPASEELLANERAMKHLMKDADAGLIEVDVGEPVEVKIDPKSGKSVKTSPKADDKTAS